MFSMSVVRVETNTDIYLIHQKKTIYKYYYINISLIIIMY